MNKIILPLHFKYIELKSKIKKKKYYLIVLINIFVWAMGLYYLYYIFTESISNWDFGIILPLFSMFFSLGSRGKEKKLKENKKLQGTRHKMGK